MLATIRRFFHVRPGEGAPLLFTFLYVALAVGSFLLAKPIRNGLFLGEFGASRLVYVYVAVPLVLSALVPVYTTVSSRLGERAVITGSLVLLALNVLAFWWALTFRPAPWLSAAFYVWVNCYGVIAPVQAWTFASAVFDTRQARRLFGLVGAGASLGSVLGGVLAGVLVGPLGTINLLVVLSAMIGLTAVVANTGWRYRRADTFAAPRSESAGTGEGHAPFIDTMALIVRTPYLRHIALLVSIVAIVTLWTQFLFQAGAEQYFAGDADRMTRFFGQFNSALGVAALLIQVFGTGPALRRFGLGVTILLLPVLLGTGIVAIALTASLWAVLLTSAFDQGFRFSIDKATFELLYLPLNAVTKTRVKTTIDLVCSRTADGIGAVLLGLATSGFLVLPGAGLGLRGIAIMSLLLMVAWVALALALRRGYVEAIYDTITQHRLDADRAAGTVLDRTATEALAARLRDGELIEVLYALDVFRMQHRGVAHPAVRGLLRYPAPEVRSQAISVLSEAGDVGSIPDVEALLDDPDAGVRAEALLFLARLADVDPIARIGSIADFPAYSVQAGIVAFLARESSWQNLDAAGVMLQQMIADDGPDAMFTKIEAARVLGRLNANFEPELRLLLGDGNAEVVRAAVVAAGQRGEVTIVDALLAKMEDGGLREDVGQALVRLGEAVVPELRQVLENPAAPLEVRREMPGILSTIGGPDAREALVANLLATDASLRDGIVEGLGRLHQKHPDLQVERRTVEMALTAEAISHYLSYQVLGSLGSSFDPTDPIVRGIEHAIEQERSRMLGLIAPLLPSMDMRSVSGALQSSNQAIRANALELIDTVLSPDLRHLVVPLVDGQTTVEERIARAARIVTTPVTSQEEAVRVMLASANAWLKACGVYAAGALRLPALRPLIEPLASAPDALLRQTAREALQRIDAPFQPAAARRPSVREAIKPDYGSLSSGDAFGVG